MKVNKALWNKVRSWYHYPALEEPKIEKKIEGGAHFDFRNNETVVGESFVETTTKKTGLSEAECLEGLLTHEVGHYMVFPRELSTVVLAGKMLDDFFDEQPHEQKNFIFQTYADMADDTASMLEGEKRKAILKMRTASQQILPDKLNENVRAVMLKYLHYQAGQDYMLKEELQPYFKRMCEVDFLDQSTEKLRQSLFQFGEIVNDMVKDYGKGGGYRLVSSDMPCDVNIDGILKKASKGDIERALREISVKISRGEYKKVKDWIKEKGIKLPEASIKHIGTSKGELPIKQEVINYYKELSKEYALIIHKKPIKTEKIRHTFEDNEKWRAGSEPLLAMPHLSGGKFLPGITRRIKIKERNVKSTDYEIPHLLVVIDSSGSMPEPESQKSYAVLAAYCAARSYHIQESSIGVINFSGESFYLPYTRDLDEALGAISSYQGGGTVVDLELLKKMLDPERAKLYEQYHELDIRHLSPEVRERVKKKEVELSFPTFKKALERDSIDLLMFTDGGIMNLEEVLKYFEEQKTLNRATIVLSDHYNQSLPKQTSHNVSIYRVDKESDIPKIVLEDVVRSMSYHASKYEA